jgi:phosphoglycerol transferase MdoB-like AlkP superfamily enzyme
LVQWAFLLVGFSLIPLGFLSLLPVKLSFWPLLLFLLPCFTQKKEGTSNLMIYYLKELNLKKRSHQVDPLLFIPNSEIYENLSPTYPLLRYCTGFKEEKAFEIDIKNNERPHIIFLFVESLRMQDLGREGITPNLDKLVNRGVYFPHFYSNSLETFRCIYTSLFGIPYALKFESSIDLNLPLTGLIDLMKDRGYETNFVNAASWSLNNLRLFLEKAKADRIIDKKDIRDFLKEVGESSWGIYDEYLFEYALDHQYKHRHQPQFYSLSTITMHHPYKLPERYQAQALESSDHDKYLKTLSYTDDCIGKYIQGLREKKLLKDSVLFIMGDHGVNIDDQGSVSLFSKQEKESSKRNIF